MLVALLSKEPEGGHSVIWTIQTLFISTCPTSRYGTPKKQNDKETKRGSEKFMNKKLLKNFCAVFLAGFMALLLLPQSAQAQEKEAYVVKSSDKKTLTFYYDDQKSSRTGTVWGIGETKQEGNTYPAWSGTWGMGDTPESKVTTAVFDASFKNYLPQSTKFWFLN